MTSRPKFRIVTCGEAIFDLLEQSDGSFVGRPGGSPAIVAVAAARLGLDVQIVARLGPDTFGQKLRTYLTTSGVDLSAVVNAAEPTTLSVASLDGSGSATYEFYLDGCADGGWSMSDVPAALRADALYVSGTLALGIPAMAAVPKH